MKAMQRIMKYLVCTPERGLLLNPNKEWDGTKNFEFEIVGMSDSEYAKDESRRSINGWSVFLNDSPVSWKSKMMPIVALSVTEAELFSAVQCVQDMMFVMRLLNSMELKVKLPMTLYIDNKGAKDLINNWSVGGRTRHIDVRNHFLRQCKEDGLILVKWIHGLENDSDMLTKNLAYPLFKKHVVTYVGHDVHMEPKNNSEHGG